MTKFNLAIYTLLAGLIFTMAFAVNENLTVRHLERELESVHNRVKHEKMYHPVQEYKLTFALGYNEKNHTLARQNRNYLNIKTLQNGGYWEGQIGVDKLGHAIFKDPVWSIRAGIILLKNYETKHKIDTITKLINRFCTGNREAYIKFLCKTTGFKPDQKISLMENLEVLLLAMIAFESGENIGMEYIEIIKAAKR